MPDSGPSLCSVLDPRKCPPPLAPVSLRPLSSLSVATNPLTRSLLFQMPGSTRKGCILKVSGRGEWRAEIRVGGSPPTGPPRRPGSAPRPVALHCDPLPSLAFVLVVLCELSVNTAPVILTITD